jgi:glutamate racemase
MSGSRPKIGVFDSGVGGLTVLKELLKQAPNADYLYFGDTARLPYGSKSAETVTRYTLEAARFLKERGAEFLVIACNTATALAFDKIESGANLPALGVIEPGAKAAAEVSKTRKVVVIATEGTINSHAYKHALELRGLSVQEKACPLFVPLVEEGWIDHRVTAEVAHEYLDGLFPDASGPDTLVLGCTHYPLLKNLLRTTVQWRVNIVDSAEVTASEVARLLPAATKAGIPEIQFFATDSVEKFRRAGEKFLGHDIRDIVHVDLD